MIGRQEDGPVLIAEDDPVLLAEFRSAMATAGLATIAARSARIALESIAFHRPPVVVIDLAMEEGRGWELLYETVPRAGMSVLAIDRKGDTVVRRGALTAGADDVVSPPFDPEELAARARAMGRRQRVGGREQVLRHRDLVIDLASREVRVAGRPVTLTPQQFALLRALCEAGGATLHRKQLLARIASIDGEPPTDRAVDLHMSRLRRRLGEGAGYIEAVYGLGYRLVAGAADRAAPGTAADPILEALGGAVVVTDGRLQIVSANAAAGRLLGRDRSELIGRSCGEVLACRSCEGVPLGGPACIGRAAIAGGGRIGHVPAFVAGPDGPLAIHFSHAAIRSPGADPLLAIELQSID